MPTYEFKCRSCGAASESRHRDHAGKCPVCGDVLRREYGFSMRQSFQPHFNFATGQYVRNEREFKDAMKRVNADASAERYDPVSGRTTQVDSHFVAVDPRDLPPKDDTGMEEAARSQHDNFKKLMNE